jgi:hypothetical protein
MFVISHTEFIKWLEKKHAKMTPVPLPRKRPRALTLPLPPNGRVAFLRKKQITHEQLQSPFFHLPPEIKQTIYEMVFYAGNPGCIISILPRRKRLEHICGRALDWTEEWRGNRGPTTCANHTNDRFLALLRTCRVMLVLLLALPEV